MDRKLRKEEGVGLGDVLTFFLLQVKVVAGAVLAGNTTLSMVVD
jgi:hypothetical protein